LILRLDHLRFFIRQKELVLARNAQADDINRADNANRQLIVKATNPRTTLRSPLRVKSLNAAYSFTFFIDSLSVHLHDISSIV
jgi:hypothetical protein